MSSPTAYHPPTIPTRLLIRILKKDLVEEVLGDLEEKYYETLQDHNRRRANINYWYQTLHYLRPFAIKNNIISDINPLFMVKHNILLAYRNSLRNKSSFLINLIGLSTGLACALLIAMWVNDEYQIDNFNKKADRLYQVMTHHELSSGIKTDVHTQGLLADALIAEVPEIEMTVATTGDIPTPFILTANNKVMKSKGTWAGPDFFNLFSYELIHGDQRTLLQDKKSIVISESLANKLFNTSDVLGKTLQWDIIQFSGEAQITGVFKDINKQSSVQFDLLIPFEINEDLMGDRIHWGNFNAWTYVLLKNDINVDQLNKKLSTFIKEKAEGSNASIFLKSYSEKYLYGRYENGKQAGGRITYVRLFSLIAILILLIACINFMNLSTAKATQKLKDVGVRKTIGASRTTLVGQYLGESIFLSVMALLVSLIIVRLSLNSFNLLTGKHMILQFNLPIILSLLGVTLITGILAGSYPALFLSGFKPAKVLKGGHMSSIGELWTRKGLVIFQFVLSVILIVSVLVVNKQIAYIQTKNLGYNKENIITFPKEGLAERNLETFIQQLKSISGITHASTTSHPIVSGGGTTTGVEWDGKDPEENIQFGSIMSYYDFVETLGLEMLEGRTFSKEYGDEKNNLILNETAIKLIGLTNPIGQNITLWGEPATIIGVVKDFNFESLHKTIGPVFIKMDTGFTLNVIARIAQGKERETISQIEDLYSRVNPGFSFEYTFLDSTFDAQYAAESRVAVLSRFFAGLAILISCLGLLGLVTFSAQRKTKEIGIRKILGASTLGIIRLLSIDFTKMVVIAIVIALPLSYLLTDKWLKGFAYRIDMEVWFFIGSGLVALLIAWLSVGLQTLRAARANPVECLRNE